MMSLLESALRDIRLGFRLLGKHRVFSTVAVGTLAIAIGANTAVFTVVDRILLRPLPYAEPDRLATVARHFERGSSSGEGMSQSGATLMALKDAVPALDIAVQGSISGVNLVAGDETAYVQQQRVSAGFFRVLGVPPAVGREFTVEEDRIGGPPLVVLSHKLWTRVFDQDPSVIGRQVMLHGEPFTVIGVASAEFRSLEPVDLWTPLRPSTQGEGAGQNYLLVCRLRPGVEWSDVQGQVESAGTAIVNDLYHPGPEIRLTMRLVPFQHAVTSGIREPLIILWMAVGMVLLIGCVNIAGLMLARSSVRAPEIATRIALGGGRAAIVRQLLAESFVIAACGAAAGIALGYLLSNAMSVRLAEFITLPETPDLRVLAIATLASLATSALFGIVPAWQASRMDIRGMLVESGDKAIAGRARRWPARILVASEIALGVMLLVGAGLLIRTFGYLTNLTPGFDGANIITATLSLQDARYNTAARVNGLFDQSIERVRVVPGVEQVAIALSLPYERALNQGWRFEGEASSRPEAISVTYVTPDYFSALRIPLRGGRVFSDRDSEASPKVAIVNDAFVRRYARDADPIGRRLVSNGTLEVVGIVGDIQQQVTFGNYGQPMAPIPALYVPASQVDNGGFTLVHTWFQPSWIVRMAHPSPTIASDLQRALREIDPQLSFNKVRTIDEVRGDAVGIRRLQTTLLATLALIALLLAAIGIYGLVAESVNERRREFGVRIALGATSSEVLKSAMAPGLRLAFAGAAVGIALAFAIARVMQNLVSGVSVHDPLTFMFAAATVLLTAAIATLVPTLHTLRLNVSALLNRRA